MCGRRRAATLEQPVLTARGVLELVDQQVPQAIVQHQRKVRGSFRAAEGVQRPQLYLGEIDRAVRLEHQPQFRGRVQ